MLRNQIYHGRVIHRRSEPSHEFRYPVGMLCVDVACEIENRWLSTSARRRALRFGPSEWMGCGDQPLERINQKLASEGYPPCGRAFVLAQPRMLGWYFNPVCFYFCMGASGLDFIVAEINNTPWDEKYSYVLDARDLNARRSPGGLEFSFPKRFHVSPFFAMDLEYCWRFRVDEERIEIAMHLHREGLECFFAGMYLDAEPLTQRNLRRFLLRYPMQNVRTLARIYWQAARLWMKRARFYPHPETTEEVTTT